MAGVSKLLPCFEHAGEGGGGKVPCVCARESMEPSGKSGSSARTCPSRGRPAGSGIGTISCVESAMLCGVAVWN